MRLHGIQQFMFTSAQDGTIESVSMISANESWPDLVRSAKRTEAILIARGWKPAPGQKGVASLPSNPRDAAAGITDSGAIAGASFTWIKGRQEFTLAAGGLWGGIPWWRRARRRDLLARHDLRPARPSARSAAQGCGVIATIVSTGVRFFPTTRSGP